jgi:ankyrin repeat protein
MVGLCRRLVELGADVNNSASDWWLTPLSWAADAGSADAVGFLLERGADPNQDAIVGTTALHAAAVGGSSRGRNNPEAYRRTAELLVAHGVDHLRRSTGERGRTALEEAIAAGNVAVERVLRERGCTFPDEETHRDL